MIFVELDDVLHGVDLVDTSILEVAGDAWLDLVGYHSELALVKTIEK
jgi:hypothetical protein